MKSNFTSTTDYLRTAREERKAHEVGFEVSEAAAVGLAAQDCICDSLARPVELEATRAPARIFTREVEELERAAGSTPEELFVLALPFVRTPDFAPDIAELVGKRESEPTFSGNSRDASFL